MLTAAVNRTRTIGVEYEATVPLVGSGTGQDVQRTLASVLNANGLRAIARGYSHDPLPPGVDLAVEYDSSVQGETRYHGVAWHSVEVKTRVLNGIDEWERIVPKTLEIAQYLGARVIVARSSEIEDTLHRREGQLAVYRRRAAGLSSEKEKIDQQLDQASRSYDSAYLSRALALEQERARLVGETAQLDRLRALPRAVEEQLREATAVSALESKVREQLNAARKAAERDAGNLRELERLFLDCLVRARVPGFAATDVVQMRSPTFVPEVSTPEAKDMIVTSFANLGSGGKKTLFKCCFALATPGH